MVTVTQSEQYASCDDYAAGDLELVGFEPPRPVSFSDFGMSAENFGYELIIDGAGSCSFIVPGSAGLWHNRLQFEFALVSSENISTAIDYAFGRVTQYIGSITTTPHEAMSGVFDDAAKDARWFLLQVERYLDEHFVSKNRRPVFPVRLQLGFIGRFTEDNLMPVTVTLRPSLRESLVGATWSA